MNPNRNTARDFILHATKMFPQRHARALCFQVPARSFNRGFGHTMAADSLHQIADVAGTLNFVTNDHRCQKIFERRPNSLRPFFGIKRTFARRALAPAVSTVTIDDPHEHYAAFSRAPKTGFEKMNQWQTNLPELDGRNDHESAQLPEVIRRRHYALTAGLCQPGLHSEESLGGIRTLRAKASLLSGYFALIF